MRFFLFIIGVLVCHSIRAESIPPELYGLDVLVVTHHAYAPDHHNTHDMFPSYPGEFNNGRYKGGSAVKVLHFSKEGLRISILAETEEGLYRDPELSPDGKTLLLSYRKSLEDSYHIYAYDFSDPSIALSAPRQLTSLYGADDLHPLFLSDGSIAFTSTRDPKYVMCNRHISANIYRMEADGANIVKITNSTLFERPTDVLPDGRILYDRWEYSDRDFGSAQGLWTVWPDGTRQLTYYGNNSPTGAAIFGRVIPGTSTVAAILSSTHDRPWGALAVLDRNHGVDGRSPVLKTWPEDVREKIKEPGDRNTIDAYVRLPVKYTTPAPLDRNHILVARTQPKTERTALYLVSIPTGKETLLYEEESLGVYDPTPIRKRVSPPLLPSTRDYGNTSGSFLIHNVYDGTHMRGIAPGTVKTLRVVESNPKRTFTYSDLWGGEGQQNPGVNWHSFETKRILGEVPVYADGSAFFTVPQDAFVYFQLLDAEGSLIQSMRSGALVQSGETASCAGCHENRNAAPRLSNRTKPLALNAPPAQLERTQPPYNYITRVQPIFTRSCITCHGYEKKEGGLTLVPDKGVIFNASYVDLWRGRGRKGVPFGNLVGAVGAGDTTFYPPRTYGSAVSPLIRKLETEPEHRKRVTDAELALLREWVDINAPYYPDYASAYPKGSAGRGPLSYGEVRQIPGFSWGFHWQEKRPMPVYFDNPEKSPLLAGLSGAEAEKALALIRKGHDRLREKPDIDWVGLTHMPGNPAVEIGPYRPDATDAWRFEKTGMRTALETRNRDAIQSSTRHYDSDSTDLAWPKQHTP